MSSFFVIQSGACYSCYQANIATHVIYFQVWSITHLWKEEPTRFGHRLLPSLQTEIETSSSASFSANATTQVRRWMYSVSRQPETVLE